MKSFLLLILEKLGKLLIGGLFKEIEKKAETAASEVAWLREQLQQTQVALAELHRENMEIRESLMLQLQDANNKISNMKSTIHGLQTKIAKQRRRIEELEVNCESLKTVNDAQERTIAELRKLI